MNPESMFLKEIGIGIPGNDDLDFGDYSIELSEFRRSNQWVMIRIISSRM